MLEGCGGEWFTYFKTGDLNKSLVTIKYLGAKLTLPTKCKELRWAALRAFSDEFDSAIKNRYAVSNS